MQKKGNRATQIAASQTSDLDQKNQAGQEHYSESPSFYADSSAPK